MNSLYGRFGFVLVLTCCNGAIFSKCGKVASRSVSVESPWHGARCNRQIIHYEQSSLAIYHHVCCMCYHELTLRTIELFSFARLRRVLCRWSRRGTVRVATTRSFITNNHQLQFIIMCASMYCYDFILRTAGFFSFAMLRRVQCGWSRRGTVRVATSR